MVKSRWADDEEDAAAEAARKQEKEEKKRAKAEKARKLELEQQEAALKLQKQQDQSFTESEPQQTDLSSRPSKRRKLSPTPPPSLTAKQAPTLPPRLLRFPAPSWGTCRDVEEFEKLNDIEEGAYGWVSRARDLATNQVVALKRLKMENAHDGIPVTGIREIQTLMDCDHPNIVELKEVVVGDGEGRKIEKYVSHSLFSDSLILWFMRR